MDDHEIKDMEVFGVKFASLHTPPQRRLQTLATGAAFIIMAFGGIIGTAIILYLIFYTNHWPEALIYLFWIWQVDKDTCDRGGRPIEWVRKWTWWKYVRDYFPARLERVPWAEFDPKRNYLLCCFPHGVFPMGVFTSFATNTNGFNDLFPSHKPYVLVLKINFFFPLLRDLAFALGMCSASAKSLSSLLSSPGGGKAAALIVGGAEEAYYSRPGQYRLVLKKRKGFVKMALKHGSPLVPVFSFGETDLFNQLDNPKGSLIRRIQDWVKEITGVALIVPMGRGLFQYNYGVVPLRKPVYTIIGKPLEVEKVECPTQEQIDDLHSKFMQCLVELFEEQKHNYLKNADKVFLTID